jgi:uncharacterized protein (TIGR02246 family)
MKNFFSIFLLIAFHANQALASHHNSREIDQFIEELTQAMNTKDAPLVADSFARKGEVISLAGGIFKGQNQIQQFFAEGFKGPYQNAQFKNYVQYIRFEDATHAVVDGVWKITGANMANHPNCGIFLVTLSKQSAKWKANMFYSSIPRDGHTAEHGRILSWKKVCSQF